MDEAEATGSTDPQTPITVPDDEADEAASHIANMTLQETPTMRYIKAQLDLLKYLLTKAQTANDRLLIGHPTSQRLRSDAETLRGVFELIAQVESDDYMCTSEDEEELRLWYHRLRSTYAGGSEADERIARVIALERSLGLGETG